MNFYIVIPAHNEEKNIAKTLASLATQTVLPKKIVVVDDASTDSTCEIATEFAQKYRFMDVLTFDSEKKHEPGAKVVQAFYKGLESLDDAYDVVCKFDSDLVFPENYIEKVIEIFNNNPNCGMAGGVLYVNKNNQWEYEAIAKKTHLRGPIKAYRKACFEAIGGIKPSIGWDTADVLLAQYHGWSVLTNPNLVVKHLKPTGQSYTKEVRYKQGETLYKLRYGFLLSLITGLKIAAKQKSLPTFTNYIIGYFKAKHNNLDKLVTKKEGAFIRQYRWNGIKRRIGLK